MQGSDFHYWNLLYLQSAARELLQDNSFPEDLPADAFVFFMHQGYQFNFLRIEQGDASPIYYYCEGKTKMEFVRSDDTLEAFLLSYIEWHIAIEKRLNSGTTPEH